MLSPLTFLRQTVSELQKVTWPTQQEVIRLTIVVILVSIIVGLYIGGLDLLFTKILTLAAK
jgi:preprotein translocase subunit SecE